MQSINYFFLLAGLIALGFAYRHFAWSIANARQLQDLPGELAHTLKIFVYQPGVVILVSGVALLEMSFIPMDTSLLAWFIAAVNFVNLMVFLLYAMYRNRGLIRQYALHLGMMVLWIGIIVDGIIF